MVPVQYIPVLLSFAIYVTCCYVLEFLREKGRTEWKISKKEMKHANKKVAIALSVSNLMLGTLGIVLLTPMLEINERNVHNNLLKLLPLFFLSDTFFYFSHVALHIPFIYERYHKLHHTHVAPIPWTALFVHPGEFVIAFLGIFVLPVWLVGSLHWVTLSLYWSMIMVALVSSHSGLYVPSSAEHHELHHQRMKGNYGSKFGVWDHIFGTVIKT